MPPSPTDKLIVTNMEKFKQKYGAAGVVELRKAVKSLVAADAGRGIASSLVDLSDATTMARFGVPPLAAAEAIDPKRNKEAIDAVYSGTEPRPAYLLLLGAVDVIPHVPLDNPMLGDGDPNVPSDLPYACDAPYSMRVQDYLSPTRVVGRLPNVTNDAEPTALIALLDAAGKYAPRPAPDYSSSFAISTHNWRTSTELSLDAVFGSHSSLKVSPPDGHKWTPAQLKPLVHFINCHGASGDPHFYGQKGNSYPVAHAASWMSSRINEGTLVAAECCYGAELYDPALPTAMGQPGMCNTYLAGKAYAYLGSTNIAYGPASANDHADLMCQRFLLHLASGASAGRACLQSRLEYVVGKGGVLTPVDLKTFAQFTLMGDPSLTPVAALPPTAVIPKAGAKVHAAEVAVSRNARRIRRAALVVRAASAAVFQFVEPKFARAAKSGVIAKLRKLASEHGIKAPDVFISFAVEPAVDAVASKAFPTFKALGESAPTAVHAVIERLEPPANLPHMPLVRGVEAVEYPKGTVARVFESR